MQPGNKDPMRNKDSAARDIAAGKWKQLRGKVKEQWGKLTDDDLDRIDGNREQLIGRIQEAYGKGRADAEKDVEQFYRRNIV